MFLRMRLYLVCIGMSEETEMLEKRTTPQQILMQNICGMMKPVTAISHALMFVCVRVYVSECVMQRSKANTCSTVGIKKPDTPFL